MRPTLVLAALLRLGLFGSECVGAAAALVVPPPHRRAPTTIKAQAAYRGATAVRPPASSRTSAAAVSTSTTAMASTIRGDNVFPALPKLGSIQLNLAPGSSLLQRNRRSTTSKLHGGRREQKALLRCGSISNTDSRLWAKGTDVNEDPTEEEEASTRLLLVETKKSLQRASWLSWWSQVILTTVSSIILVFARNVLIQQQPTLASSPKLFLSTSGLVVSALSIIWTWGNGQRLSRRIVKPDTSPIKAALLLRRAIRVGVLLNLAGLLLHLLAAEQIVGALAIKVLTMPRSTATYLLGGAGAAALEGSLQPLDILIVQANTNSLLSHFCSLVLLLWLVDPLHKLDPPSTPEDRRQ